MYQASIPLPGDAMPLRSRFILTFAVASIVLLGYAGPVLINPETGGFSVSPSVSSSSISVAGHHNSAQPEPVWATQSYGSLFSATGNSSGNGSALTSSNSSQTPVGGGGVSPDYFYCDPWDGDCGSCESCNNGSSGGGGVHLLVNFHEFQGAYVILFNGTRYHDNQSAIVLLNHTYSISLTSRNTSFAFAYWMTDAGTIANASAQSTTIKVTTGGDLEAVVKDSNNAPCKNWGGVIEQGYGITNAFGSMVVPGVTYVGSAPFVTDVDAFWVGIGGDNGTGYLFQAGLQITYYWGTSLPSLSAFWEAYPANNPQYLPSLAISSGDILNISVAISGSTDFYSVSDFNGHSTRWANGSYSGFTPDERTAEWVGEDPTSQGTFCYFTIPATSPVQFYSETYTNHGVIEYAFLGGAFVPTEANTAYGGSNQYLTPGPIYNYRQYFLYYS
jgi:hypothetical protein